MNFVIDFRVFKAKNMILFFTLIENVTHGSRFEDKKNIIISLLTVAQ